jgi:mRNA interferase MazF
MVAPSKGSVVLVAFPFSDLSATKLRPAIVLAAAGHDDWVLCQVTSNAYADSDAVRLTEADFDSGSLHRISFARPGKLFTANTSLMRAGVGHLAPDGFRRDRTAVLRLFEE